MPDVDLTAWVIGWSVGGAVVLVVAAVVGTILYLAKGIRDQAIVIREELDRIRERTDALWAVEETNRRLATIVEGAGSARRSLGG